MSRKIVTNHEKYSSLFDPGIHCLIESRGPGDVNWLQNLDGLSETSVDETGQVGNTTMLNAYTNQAGIGGLVIAYTDRESRS